ncbi:hypothetical protein LSUE1_G005491 [Lachnellula suecica]|uniref:Methyltransferase domain-containing protein n=1 Tax=Lachnellula suecica TaxID=602035 RepID=A0A8T9C1U9_9HELO|nr:hypothetical protein LSUE1_G005491 [Lachnellula suecica]
MSPFLFTTATGEIFELPCQDPPSPSPLFAFPTSPNDSDSDSPCDYFTARPSLDGVDEIKDRNACCINASQEPSPPKSPSFLRNPSCSSTHPLIKIVKLEELIEATTRISPSPKIMAVSPAKKGERRTAAQAALISMVYNEYGELVSPESLLKPPVASELSTTGILRVLKKAYHHYFRTSMGDILADEMRGKISLIVNDGTLKWETQFSSWLFEPPSPGSETPISAVSETLPSPTPNSQPRVLELGCGDGKWCLKVKKEFPSWLIDGIDDTNHWMCIHPDLKPRDFMAAEAGGNHNDYFCVIEFLEIDPRPRTSFVGPITKVETLHRSGADVDWTDKIADRFKGEVDIELATDVPGWLGRVEARLEAYLRPRDVSMMSNNGFYGFQSVEIELEDTIPKLKAELPTPELDAIKSGNYWLNLYLVTGRKPSLPRPGDLLSDGTRQEMTASTYDAMARFNDAKTSQWKRFDLDTKLTTMLESLTTLPIAVEIPMVASVTRGTPTDGLIR